MTDAVLFSPPKITHFDNDIWQRRIERVIVKASVYPASSDLYISRFIFRNDERPRSGAVTHFFLSFRNRWFKAKRMSTNSWSLKRQLIMLNDKSHVFSVLTAVFLQYVTNFFYAQFFVEILPVLSRNAEKYLLSRLHFFKSKWQFKWNFGCLVQGIHPVHAKIIHDKNLGKAGLCGMFRWNILSG